MAASHSEFGVRHLTVVPTNFQPADSDDESRQRDADAGDAAH
ncbi:hypothetical protein [Halobacterium sp. CBA1126]|nr:hypothetical protein [Halobacterium sp. CBA1126]